MKFINDYSMFVGHFSLLNPDPDTDPGAPLTPDPDPQHSSRNGCHSSQSGPFRKVSPYEGT
jgi:hypothetical protein